MAIEQQEMFEQHKSEDQKEIDQAKVEGKEILKFKSKKGSEVKIFLSVAEGEDRAGVENTLKAVTDLLESKELEIPKPKEKKVEPKINKTKKAPSSASGMDLDSVLKKWG